MKTIGIMALACGLAGQAMAGGIGLPVSDAPVEAAPGAASSFDWTGFYAGISAAVGQISDTAPGGFTTDTSGYGLQVGYLRDLGTLVVGGELAYSKMDVDISSGSVAATRLKLIGGYDAGRFLPYGFIGVAELELSNSTDSITDTVGSYGLGVRYAFGPEGQYVTGLEYIVEEKKNFANTGDTDVENQEVSLRFDYRF